MTAYSFPPIDVPRFPQAHYGLSSSTLSERNFNMSFSAIMPLRRPPSTTMRRLAPFRFINELHKGDPIYVTMPYGRFTYIVQSQKIVQPTAVWVVNNVGYDRLVLSACNPIYSAAQRIIIFAKLRSVKPLGPARASG